jgi:hypothetical protein
MLPAPLKVLSCVLGLLCARTAPAVLMAALKLSYGDCLPASSAAPEGNVLGDAHLGCVSVLGTI